MDFEDIENIISQYVLHQWSEYKRDMEADGEKDYGDFDDFKLMFLDDVRCSLKHVTEEI